MNEAKLQEFMGKLVGDMGGAAIMANVILGEELGLYRAMSDGNLVTPRKLYENTHGLFDTASSPAPTQIEVGTATLTFKSCTTATLAYNFTGGSSPGATGQISLTKIGPAGPGCVN